MERVALLLSGNIINVIQVIKMISKLKLLVEKLLFFIIPLFL